MTINSVYSTLKTTKEASMTDRIYCQIQVRGHLSEQWAAWFGDLAIENRPDGVAILAGSLPDQAALYGVLNRMRDLGLDLITLKCDDASLNGISSNW
jgi:hypothetical protein